MHDDCLALLNALLEGDLAAGLALVDRLKDAGDTRSNKIAAAIGWAVREINSVRPGKGGFPSRDEAMAIYWAFEEMADTCRNIFALELASAKDRLRAQFLLEHAIRIAATIPDE